MADRRKNNASFSNSSRSKSIPVKNSNSRNSGSGSSVSSCLSGVQGISQNRFQESIGNSQYYFNPHWQHQFNYLSYNQHQYAMPMAYPFMCNNLVYGNFTPAVLQPNLSYACFHRPGSSNNNQRQRQATDRQVFNPVNKLRGWEKVSSIKMAGFKFSVMSYNVLAQDLIDMHPYLYTLHDKRNLKWDFRWNNLLKEITQFKPEILCLQEVQGSHITNYYSQLSSLGYDGIYKQRTGVRTDGCAIYYKKDLIKLIEHTTVEYYQPKVAILDRDNVAIIAKFAPLKHPDRKFVVATTHLLYNPKRQDVRLAQTQLLLTEVDRIAFNTNNNNRDLYYPVILTGDLNSTPDSAVYQFITKGELKYENLALRSLQRGTNGPITGKQFLPPHLKITDECQHAELIHKRQNQETLSRSQELDLIEIRHSERQSESSKNSEKHYDSSLFSSGTLRHKFALKSVYTHGINGDPEGTTFQDEWVTVDYIFYSEKSSLGKLTLLERFKIPTKSQLGQVKLPNRDFGSDHLSLIAKFNLDV